MLHLKHLAAGLDLGVQTSTTATVAGEEGKEAGWSWGRIFSGLRPVITLYSKAEGLITRVILHQPKCDYRCGLIG